ncbi:nicotinate phosphoribosyltransferase [Haloferula luteola]|uniref:Nicotinate phosphoribosyltransferase n=1 Tax=Haloferula luteola TaxID=595692 RepID=A0A840VA11_9BACT|nr:nicotinate phosphoribosyltransferase [Haloferula luteola]MBB5351518.1 nicotinate phosphoribosyltransferase [Haloferula luteola]
MNSPLQTDLYQLTMAAAYWHSGTADQESVFHAFFRQLPFGGGYAIAAGLESVLEWVETFHFAQHDIAYLGELRTPRGELMFPPEFLKFLSELRLDLSIDAVAEGEPVFAHEPLLRVQGPILHAQLVETALLNMVNFQTLVATKAARMVDAAGGAPVVEFGYRRAQGPDGALSASRAAWMGGCAGTSNVLAGQRYGIPVRGTHAHSWVMSFDEETEAFDRYAEAMPDNSILLVDTYDTLQGVRNAILTARKLRERGHELGGIRLDSGDLAWLSQQARMLLDEAGFAEVKIVASNDLDESIIESLRQQGARIDVWGVGTRLVTGGDQAALGGVYKLAALRQPDGSWKPRIKRSEQSAKSSIPGRLQVRRFRNRSEWVGDAIYDEDRGFTGDPVIVDPADPVRRKKLVGESFDLLQPVWRGGRRVGATQGLDEARERCRAGLAALHPGVRRAVNPHRYPAGLERGLWQYRETLLEARA